MENGWVKWKHLVRYPFHIGTAKRILEKKSIHFLGNRPLGFDLYTDQLLFDCGRHLTCLAAHAKQIGSNCYVRCDKLLLAAIARKTAWISVFGDAPCGMD